MSTRPDIQVCKDDDGFWFIGQKVQRRFLWWKWTEWVNIAKHAGTDRYIVFPTYENAMAHYHVYFD